MKKIKQKKNEFIFTFGVDSENCRGYVSIKAPTQEEALDYMVLEYGTKWAFCYRYAEGEKVIKNWGLIEMRSEDLYDEKGGVNE